jgi:hypothetical protein
MINESHGQTGALDRVAARVERDLKKAIQIDLPNSFDVTVYVDFELESLATSETNVEIDGVNANNPSNYYFIRARSMAGHHDHLLNPVAIKDDNIRKSAVQNLFQAQVRKDHPNIGALTNGSIWSCDLLGGELVRLNDLVQARVWRFQDGSRRIVDPTNPQGAFKAQKKQTASSFNPVERDSRFENHSVSSFSQDKVLFDLIAKCESKGNYNAANVIWYPNGRGGKFTLAGGTDDQSYAGKKLTELTFGEVKQAQATYFSTRYPTTKPQNSLFAMGKYQVIPKTMLQAMTALGLTDTDLFNMANQDRIVSYLVYSGKGGTRQSLADYLLGKNTATLDEAQLDLAREFSSIPKDSSGKSYYANEEAHNDAAIVRSTLTSIRKANIAVGRTTP